MIEDEIPLIEIQDVLCKFVHDNPEAWAPIISTWSLELLGKFQYFLQYFCSIFFVMNFIFVYR